MLLERLEWSSLCSQSSCAPSWPAVALTPSLPISSNRQEPCAASYFASRRARAASAGDAGRTGMSEDWAGRLEMAQLTQSSPCSTLQEYAGRSPAQWRIDRPFGARTPRNMSGPERRQLSQGTKAEVVCVAASSGDARSTVCTRDKSFCAQHGRTGGVAHRVHANRQRHTRSSTLTGQLLTARSSRNYNEPARPPFPARSSAADKRRCLDGARHLSPRR
jgi:hypothetical protein